MSISGIKLFTFDATNTLLKFRLPPWQFYTVVARDHGFKGTSDEVKERMLETFKLMSNKYPNFGKSDIKWEEWWRQVVKQTFKGHLPASAEVNDIATRLINEFKTSKCWSIAEGSEKLLQLLHNRGITVGVISNFDPRLYDILKNVNLHTYFDFVVTSYEFGYSKPDERIFKHALKMSKCLIKPSSCLHIGDDVKKDYQGARAAGWNALVIKENFKAETPPASDHVFKNLEDLSLAIEKNNLKL